MPEHTCKILIASAVRQKPQILREFLASLKELDRTGILTNCLFVDNNDSPDSSEMLKNFRLDGSIVYLASEQPAEAYCCSEETHYWNNNLIWKVAAYKDFILQYALDNNYSHVFMIDSDLVLHPLTLKHLLNTQKDIVSEIFWTKWTPDAQELPQVWLEGQYSQALPFLEQIKKPGLYEVGGLGACTLISRTALSKKVSYSKISNVDYWGEDRHFCIRAVVLGLRLFVDTHYPAFHIYRDSDLAGVAEYKTRNTTDIAPPSKNYGRIGNWHRKSSGNTLTLSMIVKNEGDRYLAKVLRHARQYIDAAVIIDDASKDDTVDICLKELDGIPLNLIRRKRSGFSNEYRLRQQQWRETIKTKPDWILALDADEMFEDKIISEIQKLINQDECDVFAFRLYDFWDETHYREDQLWCAHKSYRPFLVRYVPDFQYKWKETPQHCGRFPYNLTDFAIAASPVRIKHFGWIRPEERARKYKRYLKLDPKGLYGIKEQYDSILDISPNLIKWEE